MINVLAPLVPIVADLLGKVTNTGKKAAHGISVAFDGRVGLALVCLWLYPFITLFLPYLQTYTIDGFKALESAPDWYVDFIVVFSAALVGVAGYKGRRR